MIESDHTSYEIKIIRLSKKHDITNTRNARYSSRDWCSIDLEGGK